MTQMVEVVRLRLNPERADAFVAGRAAVDAEVGQIAGWRGTELIHLAGDEWILLIYWNSREEVEAAQKITATLQVISDWLAQTDRIESFQTAELPYTTR